jgi:hypothetical protein
VALRWRSVAGALDYVVEVEHLPPNERRWRELAELRTRSTRVALPTGLDGLVRWSVRARDATGLGPASAGLTLRCSAPILR